MDVERSFVSHVLATGEIHEAIEHRITADFFEDEEVGAVWTWVLSYWQRYAKVPGAKALDSNYPNFRVVRTDEPLQYYVDQMVDARTYSILEEGVAMAATRLKERDIGGARDILADAYMQLQREISVLRDVDITETYEERIQRYRSYRDLDGKLRGLPSGFGFIDRVTLGFQPEQLITYVGLPKVGKSTTLLLNAMAVQVYGKRGLVVGFEMANEEQEARYDAFKGSVDWLKLMGGRLGPKEFKRLETNMRQASNLPPLIFSADRSATTTVSGIAAKIEEHKPDICFIDGTYMMETETPGLTADTPQGLTSITRSLKRLAQRARIPIVNTTQVLPSKYSAKKGITIDSIGYTSSFAQDSDVIIGTEHVEGEADVKRLRLVAARNARAGLTALVRWDWENAEFEEMDDDFSEGEAAVPV